jgi:hypothetical protein
MSLSEQELDRLIKKAKKTMKPGCGYIADSKLRNSLVPDYGLDGLRVIMSCEHPRWDVELVPIEKSDSVWAQAGSSVQSVARSGLGPLAERLPRTFEMLLGAELVCAGFHTAGPKAGLLDRSGWFLLYLINHSEYGPQCWVAGSPQPRPTPPKGWDSLPQALLDIYHQHDGFGVLMDEFGRTLCDPGVMPSCCIGSPNFFNNISGLDSTKLLRFTRGTGQAGEGGWCFSKLSEHNRGLTKGELAVVEYEDEMESCGDAQPFGFYEFLDRYLTGQEDELVRAEFF